MTFIFSNKDITDSKRAYEFSDTFSNMDYYKDPHFQRCMRNWNLYQETEEVNIELLFEWEEVLYKDFYKHALEVDGDWRGGLE